MRGRYRVVRLLGFAPFGEFIEEMTLHGGRRNYVCAIMHLKGVIHFDQYRDLHRTSWDRHGDAILPLMFQPPGHLCRHRSQQMGMQHLSLRISNHKTDDLSHPSET